MKSQFIFIALPASALVASSAFAVQYLDLSQAQLAIFPNDKLTSVPLKLTPAQRNAIEHASGVRLLHDEQRVWRAANGSWFIVDEVIGKHEFITYAVGLNAAGAVKQVEIMDYRETYGYQVRDKTWREQFVGKTSKSPLKLDVDIKNIAGATLSSRHITDGVKRTLALYEVALKK